MQTEVLVLTKVTEQLLIRVGKIQFHGIFFLLIDFHLKMGLMDIVPAGVVTGDNLMKLMEYCRDNQVNEIQCLNSKQFFLKIWKIHMKA